MTFELKDFRKAQAAKEPAKATPPLPRPTSSLEARVAEAAQQALTAADVEIAEFASAVAAQPPAAIDLIIAAVMRLARLGAHRAGLQAAFKLADQAISGEIALPPK
mgnify:CR=1 FL=1